jgi:hypothetical protein
VFSWIGCTLVDSREVVAERSRLGGGGMRGAFFGVTQDPQELAHSRAYCRARLNA